MKKIAGLMAMVFVFAVVLAGTSFAQERIFAGPAVMIPPASARTQVEASWLIGQRVWTKGDMFNLGQIDSLVFDQANCRVTMVILDEPALFWGNKIAVPFEALYTDASGTLHLNVPVGNDLRTENPWGYELPVNYMRIMSGLTLPKTVDPAFTAYVYDQFGIQPYWTEGTGENLAFYNSSHLIGTRVDLAQGGAAGTIDDFVIDADGHVALVTLTGVPDKGDMVVAVPYTSLRRAEGDHFVLNLSGDQLAAAPVFTAHMDMGNRAYVAGVYRQFGIQPYWTDETMIIR